MTATGPAHAPLVIVGSGLAGYQLAREWRKLDSQTPLLIISQESRLLLEVTRTGEVLSSIDLRRLSGTAEGVTIDELGNIYIVDEQPRVFVFLRPTPAVPEPETYALLLAGLGLLGFATRRRVA